MRIRFMRDMGESLEDYELLELLLMQSIPRRDVKPLAKSMIARFGDFGGVLAADIRELQASSGISEATAISLKVVASAGVRMLRHKVMNRHVLNSWDSLMDYVQLAMGREKVECFRLLFLDNKNRLIADEVQQKGTVNHTPLYPREVVKRALDIGASAIIMVHNHPSGDPTPSREDIDMTRTVAEALSRIGITLHDHIVVGRGTYTSFKSKGLL